MSRRKLGYLLFVGMMSAGFGAAAQTFKPINLQMSAYVKTDNQKRFENSKIIVKALDKYRIEQSVGAQTITTIANGTDFWEIRSLNNTCQHKSESRDNVIRFGRQTVQGANPVDEFRKKGGRRVGMGKIGGVSCDVFRHTDTAGMVHTIWVQPDGKIRRLLSKGTQRGAISLGAPVQEHSLESRIDYIWLDASRLDEALFRPPAGMKISEAHTGK